MRIPGAKKARLTGRWIRSRLTGGAIVLGYHRVADPDDDVFDICVAPDRFERHLETLQRRARTITLSHAVESVAGGNQPARSVVVTFDDGYAEIVDVVRPLLERYEVPATVFVPSGAFGKELWWDRLERLVCFPEVLPYLEDLPIPGFDMPANTRRKQDLSRDTSTGRGHLVKSLYQALLTMTSDDRDMWLGKIERWADVPEGAVPAARVISESELKEIAACDLITVGSHSVSHPILPELSTREQEMEIAQSKRDIERVIGSSVELFSYPNGLWSSGTEQLLGPAGYSAACVSHNDVFRSRTSRYRIPRFWPGNRTGKTFERWLSHWLA